MIKPRPTIKEDKMAKAFPLEPQEVKPVETKYRKIVTKIPVPESLPVLEKLRKWEPRSMSGQPLVLWHRAKGVNVFDAYGNMWLDFSSGVLVTNAGHGNPKICKAIKEMVSRPLLHHYCFPSETRANLVETIGKLAPDPLKKVFLLTTGSETVECAIKLCRTAGRMINPEKKVIVSFEQAFHGRTLGSQMIGGTPALKEWIGNLDPDMVQVPFPGDPRIQDRSFNVFINTLKEKGVNFDNICGVISETFQGGNAAFLPVEYAKKLREFCDDHKALLVFDEIQAGFGRTGKLWGFEHYGVLPDIFTLGKGISSGLPLSAVVGKPEIMDLYEPGTMTSTHTGNPVCSIAAINSINFIVEKNLISNAEKMGKLFEKELNRIKEKFPVVGFVCGKGLVWALSIVKPGTTEPDGDLAFEIVKKCVEKGLLFFAPVGFGSASVKIAPPLIVKKDAIIEGCSVLEEAISEVCSS